MTTIRVHRPTLDAPTTEPLRLAPRGALGGAARLLLVDNNKPNARALLEAVADQLRQLLPIAEVELHTKPSAGAPLDADVTRMLAARSRLVVSGLGD